MVMHVNGSAVVRGVPVVLKASGAETASTTGAAVATGPDSGSLYVEVNVTAKSGTSPTMTVVLEGSQDGTNWFTLGTVGSDGYSVGSVSSAPANFTVVAGPVRALVGLAQYVRSRSVIGGTSPSFTYSVVATLGA